jgi:hypothetical protein
MKRILGRIRELGVKIALDDFGTGYSSLNHVHEIAFDVIKVDQSFVKGLAEDEYSKSFIRLVSELAKTLGASICVEGIESLRQYNVLKDMKVKYIQGFYFDRPMPAKDFDRKYCRESLKPAAEEKTAPTPAKTDVKATKPAGRTAAKATEKSSAKSELKTEKAPAKTEGKTAEKAPAKPEGRTTEKVQAKAVVKHAEKTPVKSEGKAAEKKPGDKAAKPMQPRKK